VRILRTIVVSIVACSSLFLGINGAGVARATDMFPDLTCSSGVIAPGSYHSITITGACSIPSGDVYVETDVTIDPNASLDASSSITSIRILGNVFVQANAAFFFGCGTDHGCTTRCPFWR
jgi:hypothetical protein